MKKFFAPLLLVICGLVLLSGCANTSKIIGEGLRPEIQEITRNSDGTVAVKWQIVNTNVSPYLLSRIEHKLFLNGQLVGTVLSTSPIAVPAQTSAGATNNLKPQGNGAASVAAAAGNSAAYRVETAIVIQIYGDTTEKSALSNSGSVSVVNK